jgi:hypothetical protein
MGNDLITLAEEMLAGLEQINPKKCEILSETLVVEYDDFYPTCCGNGNANGCCGEPVKMNDIHTNTMNISTNNIRAICEALIEAERQNFKLSANQCAAGECDDFGNHRCAADNWLEISSAPKDGRHILVADFSDDCSNYGYFNGQKIPAQTVVHWFQDGFYPSWHETEASRSFPATHWRPLTQL